MSTIYIHWAYCISKCYYCNFNSVPCDKALDYEAWYNAYIRVLNEYRRRYYRNEQITSVYFGGGTPSLLPEWFVARILDETNKMFRLDPTIEITMEANPKTINKTKALEFRKAGINRLSIGVQSIIDSDLKMLGRIHSAADAISCVMDMVEIFDNVSIDMIYNRPGQNLSSWENELNTVLLFPIQHISLYELIVEPNTKIKDMIESERLPHTSSSSEFFEKTIEIARSNGFERYEVSNFAKNKHYGRHNISYWRYEDYYGIGPGSHSRCSQMGRKIAIAQIANNEEWLKWANSDITFCEEKLTEEDEFKERLLMGLRSKFGIRLNDISNSIKTKYGLHAKLDKLLTNSYIVNMGDDVILTDEGVMKLNLIIQYLTKECL